jgi:hypothetical protein
MSAMGNNSLPISILVPHFSVQGDFATGTMTRAGQPSARPLSEWPTILSERLMYIRALRVKVTGPAHFPLVRDWITMVRRAFAIQIVENDMPAKRRPLLPRRRRRLIVLGSQPVCADIGVPAEKHDQLTGMVLGVFANYSAGTRQRSACTTGNRSARGPDCQSAS